MMNVPNSIRNGSCILFILLLLPGIGNADEEQNTFSVGLPIDPNAQWYIADEMNNGIRTWNQPIDWNILPYPVMQFSQEELEAIMRAYAQKPGINLPSSVQSADDVQGMKYVSLLSSLPYDPALRDQGSCGNCWVFAPMASIELQMAAQEMPDRLSVQAFNSGWTGPTEFAHTEYSWFACDGGTPDWFVEYYLTDGEMRLIPWSNEGAAFADASCTRASCTGPQIPYNEIVNVPAYTIDSLTNGRVITTGIEAKDAASNIKTLIDNEIPVLIALFFPHREAWQDFYTFWEHGDEKTHAFDVTRYSGSTWNYAQGGGHQVVVTGYYEDGKNGYFECLNSWGGPENRPNGTFLIKMDVNYNSAYRNNVLAQMFEALVIDIGEYIQEPSVQAQDFSAQIGIQPGIARE